MDGYDGKDLELAGEALASALRKSEKALAAMAARPSPKPGQLALVRRRVRALSAAALLVAAERTGAAPACSREDLEEAARTLPELLRAVETVLPRLPEGTPQHTLALRRVRALHLALELAGRGLGRRGKT